MTSDPIECDPCPCCGGSGGVQVIPDTPRVRGWSCTPCGGQWWISVVTPRPFLDHLTATVELAAARSVLRELIALGGQTLVFTDDQLRFRLRALAVHAAPSSHGPPDPARPTIPAGRWLSHPPNQLPAASRFHPRNTPISQEELSRK